MNDFSLRTTALSCLLASGVLQADERDPQITTLQPGMQLSLVAEHPGLATPTGIDVDDQGRVWVVATHTHFRPDDYVGPEHDEILVFTDNDGDGRAEHRQVFYNATDATMDLELGPDGWVYLAERDRIMRIKDSNGDDKADLEETIVSIETEADYPHNGLEALTWHPSGDLVFGLGENFGKPWTLTGTDGAAVSGTGEGGIFRCSPDGSNMRRIAHGFWNPFGICVRADGAFFAAENDPGERPPCRLLHVVEGGDYGYQRSYGPEAHHPFVAWNGELRGTLPMIHPTGEAPCGVLPLGRGLLVPSWSDHRIDFFLLRRDGASFSADRMALIQGGRYFRPGCIASAAGDQGGRGRKRAWYLTDWVDGRYQAHGFGRLWKLEIDMDKADWVGTLDPEPLTEKARLAHDLRSGETQHARKDLMQLAADEDPFLARTALVALSRNATTWNQNDVASWPATDRVHAVLALKLAEASPDDWVRSFLADESSEVQFETMRWIADGRLQAFLPDVEQMLNRSDLDYRRFEAAIATWNTLNGKPEAGVRNPELLLTRIQDADSAPKLRAFALRMLPNQPRAAPKEGDVPVQTFPKGLTLKLLQELLSVDNLALSQEVIRTLAGNAPLSQHILAEVAADARQDASLRADAVAGLAAVADQNTDLLLKLANDDQRSVREEALRCLRFGQHSPAQIDLLKSASIDHPASADLIHAVLDPKSLETNRPVRTDTPAWLAALEAIEVPADAETGRRIFHHARLAQCSNCHRHSGRGNVVGPDLSGVNNRKDRTWLLQSILEPSRQMAPEYLPRTIILNDGRTFTGIRLRSSTHEAMRDANGQNRTFNRNNIESMVESTVSFMPTGVVKSLTNRELRDLIVFLEQGSDQ
ncbi:MAG: c-type cytochrome [Fuerstiella sp.]|nr:c-type cytochrome [Fuerstiella sp.]